MLGALGRASDEGDDSRARVLAGSPGDLVRIASSDRLIGGRLGEDGEAVNLGRDGGGHGHGGGEDGSGTHVGGLECRDYRIRPSRLCITNEGE